MEKDPEEIEEAKRRAKRRQQIAAINFKQENEEAFKRSYSSFGKLILAREKSSAAFSIGTALRFDITGGLPSLTKYTPGPQYNPPDVGTYKFKANNQGSIGRSIRPPLNSREKFTHYENKTEDFSAFPKKWNHIEGGAIPVDARIKYDMREKVPGVGRYEYNLKSIKPKTPAYYIAEKTYESSLLLKTGTTNAVGPSTYRVESAKTTSKHRDFPSYSIPKGRRANLLNKNWAKDETYYNYSSLNEQIITKKRTEPRAKIGKATRARETKRGHFAVMMERRPQSVRIPMPDF